MTDTTSPTPIPPKTHWLLVLGTILFIGVAGYGSYWYFITQQNLSFDVDLSKSAATESAPILKLTPSSTSLVAGQSGFVDVVIDTAGTTITAVELHVAISGPATVTSLSATNSSFPSILTAATNTATSATITVGSGTEGKIGSNLIVARLTIAATTGQAGTISIATTGTQAAGSSSTNNVLTAFPSTSITVVPVSLILPTVTFSATPLNIKLGQLLPSSMTATTLSWTHTGASATINQSIGAIAVSGTRSVSPTTTTTYTLTATNTDGSTPQSVTVTVVKADDVDGSGTVTIQDYAALVTDFGKTGTFSGDIDGNGKVDIFDYNIFVTNYAGQVSLSQ